MDHAFSEPTIQFRLNRLLYALCWTGTDRPSVLFDRAVVSLLANKVVLPGLTMLKRVVARVRSRANNRLWRRLTERVTAEQRQRLESLLVVPQVEKYSALDQLRDGSVLGSPASDQYTGLNGVVVPSTLRDSLVLLSVVLEQETELKSPTPCVTLPIVSRTSSIAAERRPMCNSARKRRAVTSKLRRVCGAL
jgi:hypothetical protein